MRNKRTACTCNKDFGYRLLNTNHVSRLLDISPATLRTYELEGLIRPEYLQGQKWFSDSQLNWISCMRHLIQEKGISIPGLTRLLRLTPCWEIAECPSATKKACPAKIISLEYLEQTSKGNYVKEIAPEFEKEQQVNACCTQTLN